MHKKGAETILDSSHLKYDMAKKGWTLLEDPGPSKLTTDMKFVGVAFLKNKKSYVSGDVLKERAKDLYAELSQADLEFLEENHHLIPAELRDYYLVATETIWGRGGGAGPSIFCLEWLDAEWGHSWRWVGGFGDDCRLLRPVC